MASFHMENAPFHIASSQKVQYLTLDLLKSSSLRIIRKKTEKKEWKRV